MGQSESLPQQTTSLPGVSPAFLSKPRLLLIAFVVALLGFVLIRTYIDVRTTFEGIEGEAIESGVGGFVWVGLVNLLATLLVWFVLSGRVRIKGSKVRVKFTGFSERDVLWASVIPLALPILLSVDFKFGQILPDAAGLGATESAIQLRDWYGRAAQPGIEDMNAAIQPVLERAITSVADRCACEHGVRWLTAKFQDRIRRGRVLADDEKNAALAQIQEVVVQPAFSPIDKSKRLTELAISTFGLTYVEEEFDGTPCEDANEVIQKTADTCACENGVKWLTRRIEWGVRGTALAEDKRTAVQTEIQEIVAEPTFSHTEKAQHLANLAVSTLGLPYVQEEFTGTPCRFVTEAVEKLAGTCACENGVKWLTRKIEWGFRDNALPEDGRTAIRSEIQEITAESTFSDIDKAGRLVELAIDTLGLQYVEDEFTGTPCVGATTE